MKKLRVALFISLQLILTLALLGITAAATDYQVGDIVGDVYTTDIRTYFFGEPINS